MEAKPRQPIGVIMKPYDKLKSIDVAVADHYRLRLLPAARTLFRTQFNIEGDVLDAAVAAWAETFADALHDRMKEAVTHQWKIEAIAKMVTDANRVAQEQTRTMLRGSVLIVNGPSSGRSTSFALLGSSL